MAFAPMRQRYDSYGFVNTPFYRDQKYQQIANGFLIIPRAVIMRLFEILPPLLVLDIFMVWHEFRFMLMIGFGSLTLHGGDICAYFQ